MANKKINQLVSKTAILSTDLFGIGDATTGQLFKKTIAELQAAIGGAVISVNGLVGTVVLDTDDIQELATPTNKYFTDARARGAISLTVTGNSGASTYSSGTGVLNVPTYTLAGLGGITASFLSGTSGISYNSTTGVISYSGTVYTDSSIRALLSGGTGISYNSSTGAISYSGTVYTDSSVRALISMTTTGNSGASTYNNTTGVINVPNYTLAGLGGISLTSLSGGTGITYNNTTGAISYSGTVYTDASVRALISASGAVSYNNTTGVISLTSGNLTEATSSVLTITGGTGAVLGSGTSIQVKQASSTVSGFLSSTDWSTFNSKQGTITLTTTGTSGAATLTSGTLNIPQYQSALTNPVTGTGTTGYHAKFTSSSTIGNSAIFESGNNILLVANSVLGLNTADGSDSGYLAITGASVDGPTRGGTIYLSGNERADEAGSIVLQAGTTTFGTSPNGVIMLKTNATTRLIVSSTGQVGIGKTSRTTGGIMLDVAGGIQTTNDSGNVSYINFGQYSDPTLSYTYMQGDARSTGFLKFHTNDTERLRILSDGRVGIGTSAPDVRLEVVTNTAANFVTVFNNQSTTGEGLFVNCNNTSSGRAAIACYNGSYHFIVRNSGAVIIGGTSDNGYKLYVNGTIYATGNITANSDLTLKKNLTIIDNPTDKLMQLNGYAYQWKEDDSHQYGVIAQEVEKILPYAVSTGNDGIKGVSYNQIIPVLIEAVKEQKAKIENLEILLASK